MASRKRRKGDVATVEVDMTPMIDIVFQLIIFFMIVMDMSTKDLADLVLPQSETQEEDKKPPADRMVINVDRDGDVLIGGNKYGDENLKNFLDQVVADPATPRDPANPKIIDLTVMIRGDATISFGYVQKVMQFCGIRRIWKVELGARSIKPGG